MTHSPNPGNGPEPGVPQRRWSRRLRRYGIPIGIAVVAGVGGGLWWAWLFVNRDLAPLVQNNLSQLLNRPVRVGRVERFSLTGLRFGKTEIPATPTDPDRATVEALEVGFNPLRLLLARTLDLDVTLVNPTLYVEQDRAGRWLDTTIQEQESKGPIRTELKAIRFQKAQAILLPYPKPGRTKIPVQINPATGEALFFDRNRRITYEVSGTSLKGGTFQLQGETVRPSLQTRLTVRGQEFGVAEIDRLIKLPINLDAGRVNGNVEVEWQPEKAPRLTGTARFKDVNLGVTQLPQRLSGATGSLSLQDTLIKLEGVTARLGRIPLRADGEVDTRKGFNLLARVDRVAIPDFLQTFKIRSPLPATGVMRAEARLSGPLQQPVLTGVVRNVSTVRVDRVDVRQVSSQFLLSTARQTLAIQNLRATPAAGGLVTGQGQIRLNRPQGLVFDFRVQDVPGDPIARVYAGGRALPVTVGRVNARAQIIGPVNDVQTIVQWQAPEATYAGTGEVIVSDGNIFLRNTTLQVEGGTVTAQARARGGQWQAVVAGAGVQLSRFSNQLRGQFSGQLALSGRTTSFDPSTVRAQGQVRLSQGISLIDRPLTAQVAWDGQRLNVQQAIATGFQARGFVLARLQGPGAPQITGLDLDVNLQDYSLASFPVNLPDAVNLAGTADFNGRITGTPTAPNVNGSLALQNLNLNGLRFEPYLQGTVNLATGRRADLRVAGQQDLIAASLDGNYRPISLDVRRGEAIATGRRQGELFRVSVQQFPLDGLQLPGTVAGLGQVRGRLSGDFALNLRTNSLVGENVIVANPRIGNLQGDQAQANFTFANGVARLVGSEFRKGESRYSLNGSLDLRNRDPRFQGEVLISQGRIQDILTTLQVFRLDDLGRGLEPPAYGRAADLATVPVGLPQSSILNQLRRFSEINALLQKTAGDRQNLGAPEFADVRGVFGGKITVSGSPRTGVNAQFDLQAQNVEWRPFRPYQEVNNGRVVQNDNRVITAREVIVRGSFEDGVLNLLPLRLQVGEGLITFSGQLGGNNLAAQLRVANFPIEELTDLYPLPIGVTGKLNGTATISGSRANPQAVGELSLVDGSLNGTQIETVRSEFGYTNARLNFSARAAVSGPEPIRIVGNIPYRLPFATVYPNSNEISLTVNVQNEGLAIVNLLVPQVAWQGGQGSVQLRAGGTLFRPQLTGEITLQNGTVAIQALPDPLTNVTGQIRLTGDRIQVQSLQGRYGNGDVAVRGILPIFASLPATDPDAANPLSLDLTGISINLKGLYQGGVDGQVVVQNTAFEPQIGGGIRLSRGQVQLAASGAAPGTGAGAGGGNDELQRVEFQNLVITLGNGVQIVNQPLLNFVATGDLTINGPFGDLRPEGTISLRSGQVNLFTTQFVLARGYPQTAIFEPQRGLDPVLNVRLVASVPEVTRARIPTSNVASEVSDDPTPATNLGSLQTVRVEARVNGPASQLADSLELTSSPARSRTEIVALLGGTFINTLGRGDTTLGLANLAGSALLTNIQGFIGNALGLSEFRLFPTVTTDERNEGGSTLGLAAEAGIDITRSLSFSVLRILTSDQPTQFGLRYRVNDNIILRGSTDFSGENRAVVEYESRF